jgi:hypothetical protein
VARYPRVSSLAASQPKPLQVSRLCTSFENVGGPFNRTERRFSKNEYTMRSLKFLFIVGLFISGLRLHAQTTNSKSEIEQITATLMDYIEGTANGEPERLRRAFHPDFNLYTVTDKDSLRIRSGKEYVGNIQEGEKSDRIGRIISIDYEKDAAIAKAEIIIPNWRIFTDYFLLLKYEGTWKIVQKSYTWREYPKSSEK